MGKNLGLITYFMMYVVTASTNFFFVKFALKYLAPLPLMSIRYAIAGVTLALISLAVQGNFKLIINNKDMLLLALFSSLSSTLWAYGLVYVDPASSALFSYTMPFFALILSPLLTNERPRLMNIVGVTIGFSGVVLYAESYIARGFSLIGALFTIANAVFWALYSTYFKRLGEFDGFSVVVSMFFLGSLMMALPSLILYGPGFLVNTDWGNADFLFYLLGTSVIGGALLFLTWYLIVNVAGITNAVSYIFAVPALTLLLEYIVLGIKPTPLELVGSGVMFLGIYLSSLR
ncbi:DMT family transporter [Vulcanisaeta thermophila]|uniref:DMT family transporter n=1 Tax=Vulcanisaeta thermophila TaxID=867917 RepID=UPI0008533460|nr:DMT family transporter [Vulcanisaeta thermophila]